MNLLRRLQAPPNPLLQAYTDATGRTVQDAVGDSAATGTSANWIPAPECPEIWAALAAVGDSNGVIDRTTAGLPTPASTEGNLL